MRPIVQYLMENHFADQIIVAWNKGGYDLRYWLAREEGTNIDEVVLYHGGDYTGRSYEVVVVNANDLYEVPSETLVSFVECADEAYVYCISGMNIELIKRLHAEYGWDVKEVVKNRVYQIGTGKDKVDLAQDAVWYNLGGGIGDMLHHISCDEHARAMARFKKKFPEVAVHLFHSGPKVGADLAPHLFDEYHKLTRPLEGPRHEIGMKGMMYMDKFLEQKGIQIADLAKGVDEVPIPILDKPLTMRVTNSWLLDAVTIHPFVSYEVKLPCHASQWISIIKSTIEAGYPVFIVGSLDIDRQHNWNRELIAYIEESGTALSEVGRKKCDLVYADIDDFDMQCRMMRETRALIAGDSSFRHAARYYKHPTVLLMNPSFYQKSLAHMEEQEYDYNWYTEVREKRALKDGSIQPYNFARTIWGTTRDDNIADTEVLTYLNSVITSSALISIPVPAHLATYRDALQEINNSGFSLDQSKQWEIPFCLHEIGGLTPGAKALDAGCGSSVLTRYLAERGLKVTGLDSEEDAKTNTSWKMPKKAAEELGLDIEWKKLSIEDMKVIKNGTYDYTFCISVLEHMEPKAREKGIKELCRVTNIGGYVAISWDLSYRDYDPALGMDELLTGDELVDLMPSNMVPVHEYSFDVEDSIYVSFDDMKATVYPWCQEHGFAAVVYRRVR